MREVKPTQKPVPSSDIKDLFFNSGLLDIWATSLEPKYIDRFGNCHLTAAGMEWLFKELVEKFKVDINIAIVAAGYITIDSFQQGADLPNNEITLRNHILRDETTGEYYRWDGDLPKPVPAGSTPQSTGGIGKGAWVSVGDAGLRKQITPVINSLSGGVVYPENLNEKVSEGYFVPIGVSVIRTDAGILHLWDYAFAGDSHTVIDIKQNQTSGYDVTTDKGVFEFVTVDVMALRGRVTRGITPYSQMMINIDGFGGDPEGNKYSDLAISKAVAYARSTSRNVEQSTIGAVLNNVAVTLSSGGNYKVKNLSLSIDSARVDFTCPFGIATIFSDGENESVSMNFDRIYNTVFENINFVNFKKLMRWNTNNTDGARIKYKRCSFQNIGKAIDTTSFDLSRSTIVTFEDCHASRVDRLIDSYCDNLEFYGGSYRNNDKQGAFIVADSLVSVTGGIWTPFNVGEKARWFDIRDDNNAGSRGFYAANARFGPENGGIPIVYNFMKGDDVASGSISRIVAFSGGRYGSSSALTPRGVVVLASDGNGNSIAPNAVTFNSVSWSALGGAVVTEKGEPVDKKLLKFVIELDAASQARIGDVSVNPGVNLVDPILDKFVVNRLYNSHQITSGSTISVAKGTFVLLNYTAQETILNIIDGYDGMIATLKARNGNCKIKYSESIRLNGRLDFNMTANSTLTLIYDRAQNSWSEIGRSVG